MSGIDCKGTKYQEIPIGRATDLSNKKYGELMCICRVIPDKIIKHRDTFWLCECSCGNFVVASAHGLNKQDILSCGCYHKRRVSQTSKKDEIGNIYGYLTVIEEAPHINNQVYWLCECRCGNKVVVKSNSLRSGNTRSCGCLQKEVVSNTSLKNEIGNKYGKLLVIDKAESKRYKDGCVYSQWKCLCDCGNTAIVKGINLRTNSTLSCGCLVSKGEAKIKKILDDNNIEYMSQYTINDCISKKEHLLKFDFAIIQDKKILCLIEYQGIQHYEATLWENPFENDNIKREYCRNNNIRLEEIPYWDYDKLDLEYLKNIINNTK